MATKKKKLKKGDKVKWQTSQNETTGTVKKRLTTHTKIRGHKAAASKENPEYLVETDKSRKQAIHKPETLKKVKR